MKLTSPVKAIRAKCLDCSCGQIVEVRNCRIQTCALWPFRFGKNPFHAKARAAKHLVTVVDARQDGC